MGSVPDWASYVHAAQVISQHPAVLAGLSETIDAYCWTVWIIAYDSATREAKSHRQSGSPEQRLMELMSGR